MMKPEHRIERSIVELCHMSSISSHFAMYGVVNIFQTSKGSRIRLPDMIAECSEALVVRIVHENVDVALERIEL
jgi:hypothetical protein